MLNNAKSCLVFVWEGLEFVKKRGTVTDYRDGIETIEGADLTTPLYANIKLPRYSFEGQRAYFAVNGIIVAIDPQDLPNMDHIPSESAVRNAFFAKLYEKISETTLTAEKSGIGKWLVIGGLILVLISYILIVLLISNNGGPSAAEAIDV